MVSPNCKQERLKAAKEVLLELKIKIFCLTNYISKNGITWHSWDDIQTIFDCFEKHLQKYEKHNKKKVG
jgi:hypothetical protein